MSIAPIPVFLLLGTTWDSGSLQSASNRSLIFGGLLFEEFILETTSIEDDLVKNPGERIIVSFSIHV